MDKTRTVDWKTVTNFIVDALEGYGVPREDAKICADVLTDADKKGIESHGINRLKPIYIDRIKAGIQEPLTKIDIIKETASTAVLDANNGMGMVASYKAMEMAMDKARKNGIAMVALRNSTHYGAAGYWTDMAAKKGLVAMTGTNARPSIAPTFGVENKLGTNPLTVSAPTGEDFPFMLDCATSIIQRGKIEYWNRLGQDVPSGMVVGKDGQPQTDSAKILQDLVKGEAALAPLGGIGEEFGGHKGYGYATIVELFSAAFSGADYLGALSGVTEDGHKKPILLGHWFIVIDPEAFMGLDIFEKIAGGIMKELRESKKAPGKERIYTAGEKEHLVWLERKEKGLPINEALQKEIIGIRDELKLDYSFSFEK
ncbi:MAG TPA: Ldh family oxidoreductase [Clostridia bacterium]|nr:Ldh family oxidoreductase [Clostridia bacterium]